MATTTIYREPIVTGKMADYDMLAISRDPNVSSKLGTLDNTGDVLIVVLNFTQSSYQWDYHTVTGTKLSPPSLDIDSQYSYSADGISYGSFAAIPALPATPFSMDSPMYLKLRYEHTGTTSTPIDINSVMLGMSGSTVEENLDYFLTTGNAMSGLNEIVGNFCADCIVQKNGGDRYQVMNAINPECKPNGKPVIYYHLSGMQTPRKINSCTYEREIQYTIGAKINCKNRGEQLEQQVNNLHSIFSGTDYRADSLSMNPADPSDPKQFFGVGLNYFGIQKSEAFSLTPFTDTRCGDCVNGYEFLVNFTLRYKKIN